MIYLAFRTLLPRIFTNDDDVVASVASTMYILVCFLPFDHAQVSAWAIL